MAETVAKIDCARITDWPSFHDEFQRVLGFPLFYGRNLDAWIDCMSDVDDPEAGMTQIHVEAGDILTIELCGGASLKRDYRELYDAIEDCSSSVNSRRVEVGEPPVLAIRVID